MNLKFLMFNKITSSRHHDKMVRSVEPLKIHLGVNHFWYNRVTYSGQYAYFGSHTDWSAYCSERPEMIRDIPYLFDPHNAKDGIQLLGYSSDEKLQKLLDVGRNKYNTHFNLQISKKTSEGFEGFGFGCNDNTPETYERLINEIPLLTRFIKDFKKTNAPIFSIVDEYQANLVDLLGFDLNKNHTANEYDRNKLLERLGIHIPVLSNREFEVLKYCANGFPVSYISEELAIGKRTIESYIITLKDKLNCESKVELIEKAKGITDLILNYSTY